MPVTTSAGYASGYSLDAFGVGDRCSPVFLNNQ